MNKYFSPSQNILINNFEISEFILTSNTQEVFDSFVNNFVSGIRSINLIGAYGTGKSTFLNALVYHLKQNSVFVEPQNWKKFKKYDVLKLVGSYDSIIDQTKELIGSKNSKPNVLVDELEELIKKSNNSGKGFILIIDEFGKFLEYASLNGAEKELYFLQQIAELFNQIKYEAAFITTLHQDFSAYAVHLNRTQRNEWTKVKGRFKELTFNEPVEQLLLLASKKLSANPENKQQEQIKELFKIISEAKAFPLKDYFKYNIAQNIFPLDLLSASVLALALQQYGQNERSLFTFLNTNSYYGLSDFNNNRQNFYAIANVYDYLNYNLYSFLNSKANIHYAKWAEIKNALERIEGEIADEKLPLYQILIKTIGLLNLFSHAAAKLDQNFLALYIELTSKIEGVEEAIIDLRNRKLIAFNKHSNRFFYSDTTIVDIDEAIQEASQEISRANNIVSFLNSYFPLAPLAAKRAYYKTGTPRVFEYKITETPYDSSIPAGQVDGYINLIFNDAINEQEIINASQGNPNAVLYAHFLKVEDIKVAIQAIETAEIAKAKYPNDKIIQRELSSVVDIQKTLLNYYLYEGFYDSKSVSWYFKGVKKEFLNSKVFNSFLSDMVTQVYDKTPIFISELANKTKLSPSISTARKSLIDAILKSENLEGLGIDGFPPQKSIYLSLLLQTGIHQKTEEGWSLEEITDASKDKNNFIPLFQASNDFINSTKGAKRSITELYDMLEKAPFKLKRGFLDFLIPIYLIMKSDDFAMYGVNGFIPEIDSEVLELLVKNPNQYAIKAFDTDGIKVRLFNQYRDLLALGEENKTSNTAFIKTIIPFFKFYKELKDYVKQTKKLSKKAREVRNALTDATEPEKLFFEDLPKALGYDLVQLNNKPELLIEFNNELQTTIRELRNAYDELQNKFEGIINSLWGKDFSFIEYKNEFKKRYQSSLKQYLLLPYQKTFYDRLCSPLEDRTAWLSSVTQATVGKTLDKITDKEVDVLQERFLNLIRELDNLNEFAVKNVNLEEEHVYKLEITMPGSNIVPQTIRLSKSLDSKLAYFEQELGSIIEKENKSFKIAILANLLKKEIEENGK